MLAEVVCGHWGKDQATLRSQRPGSEANKRIAGASRTAQPDLAGGDDQPMIGLDVVGFALPLDETEHAMLGQRLASRAHSQVNSLPDPARSQADFATKIISLAVAQAGGHGFGFAGDQPVESAPRREVQCVADVEQPLVRAAYADVRTIRQPAGGERSQHRHIAEPSARLLEIRLEQVGSVTEVNQALVQ